ncbi:AlbA family DNA-binding domain-containing protein [Acuticoccus yangtzensis]|uniref:AlbA family DNA-binding domain-containing protein n=1 Tax=Acuticoccus yangtzensis TaxID=1443441 RepID=UPI0009499A38|nr:ATP-binding protein [Acuticoccus yangtzensis]
MGRRKSISDHEISLIKAMIRREIKNAKIQFYFNRPDRPVNNGRISQIKSGVYSNSREVEPSSDAELDAFMADFEGKSSLFSASVPRSTLAFDAHDPTSSSLLRSFFTRNSSGQLVCLCGESDQHECKESFGFKYSDKWLKAIAGLANNKGGYIFFGVKEEINSENGGKSYHAIGLKSAEFFNADPSQFAQQIGGTFDPTPSYGTATLEIEALRIGVVYVYPHQSKPVVASRQSGTIRESDIYFRYFGETRTIKSSDLRAILDEREVESRRKIIPMLDKVLSLGAENTAIADLRSGTLDTGATQIEISPDLVEKIKFIKEGSFEEKLGAPALRIVGEATITNNSLEGKQKGFINPNGIISDFINQIKPHFAKDYIKTIVENCNGAWMPIFYFARQAGLNNQELVDLIRQADASNKRKALYIGRVRGDDAAYYNAIGAANDYLCKLETGYIPEHHNTSEAITAARAIKGLSEIGMIPKDALFRLLGEVYKTLGPDMGSGRSELRRAVARVDEILFKFEARDLQQ